jgi:hypothetical protein
MTLNQALKSIMWLQCLGYNIHDVIRRTIERRNGFQKVLHSCHCCTYVLSSSEKFQSEAVAVPYEPASPKESRKELF